MRYKWNVEFFVKIGLIPSAWIYYNKMWKTYTLEHYLERITKKHKMIYERKIKKNKEKGIAYYTQERLKKMDYAFSR